MSGPPLTASPHDRELVAQVHPPDWIDPEPAPRYHLVVVGAGTAGLVTAAGAAGLGARVALVERHLMGGDCLNVGCVPSKALIASARAAAGIAAARALGVELPGPAVVDFPAVMERMRGLRAGHRRARRGAAFHATSESTSSSARRRFVAPDAVGGRRPHAALRPRRRRHRRARLRAADSGPRRGRLPHERDDLRSDRAAATASR